MKTDPTIREWMYAREMLRRLGFTPDELYFEVAPSGVVVNTVTGEKKDLGGPIISLTILRGQQRFAWTIGATALPLATIEDAYRNACELWNRHDANEWSLAEFRASRPMREAASLITVLREKGFDLSIREDAAALDRLREAVGFN